MRRGAGAAAGARKHRRSRDPGASGAQRDLADGFAQGQTGASSASPLCRSASKPARRPARDDPMTRPPITAVQAYGFRFPLVEPVITSFGRMGDRPAVFVRMEDEAGGVGWGEVWCNFPAVGAEHRVRLVNDLLAPLTVGRDAGEPGELWRRLGTETSVLALQSGEFGPIAQVIAGLDIAHWDLAARRAGRPLWRMLGGAGPTIPVYASGINPVGAGEMAARALASGHRAFKLKVGFGLDRDDRNLAEIRREVGDLFLAVDANQGWTLAQALDAVPRLARHGLGWLEEPLRADVPWSDWAALVEAGAPPLAGGENIASEGGFEAALSAGMLGVIQPDVAKWGGITMCVRVARAALAAGKVYGPHYLGGGIGLLASAHLLAGVGGTGKLEIDVNPNPLRDGCCGPLAQVREGVVTLGEEPGLGVVPDLEAWAPWRTL